jgi:4-amino-4-deoxy-L-arabinose transferase-like glycosyltransferase
MEQPKPPWFVAWIELGVHTFGRRNLDLIILFSTVVPYALLAVAVTATGRCLTGPWGGFFSLVCLAASPLSLAFGGKVMVETFLALWVVLVYYLTAHFLTDPSRKNAALLGLAIALALLTKLTTALFLVGPLVYGCVFLIRSRLERVILFKRLALSLAVCVAVAGPWYAKNLGPAVKFAFFSSKYNQLATGRAPVAAAERAAGMASDMPGWPLSFTIAATALAAAFFGREGALDDGDSGVRRSAALTCFTRIAFLGAGGAAIALLYPAYFDTRFLLPIWPVVAVAFGSRMSLPYFGLPALAKASLGLGFAGSLFFASMAVAREPLFPTYWSTTALIDNLVKRYGVSNVVNVGNCAAWNVCKTGLMNELRENPASCFVLHDLTKASAPRTRQLLMQADAVLVLGRTDLSEAVVNVAPGLNRGYDAVVEYLRKDADFRQVEAGAIDRLPELLVYVRQTRLEEARKTSKLEARRRR